MASSLEPSSALFYRLRSIRRVLPLAVSLPILAYEVIEHGVLSRPTAWGMLAGDFLLYGFATPALVFLTLTWLLRRVCERDEAEARLAALYEVSRQSASTGGLEELQQIALTLPERAGLAHAAASLVVQEAPDGPWLLAGARGMSGPEIAVLQEALAGKQAQPACDRCSHRACPPKSDCSLLGAIRAHAPDAPQAALCLSLSRESSRRVILSVYLPDGASLPAHVAETLDSMGAGLAVALDRARLRAREWQLLQQVGRAVRTQQLGLVPTLERILADIAAEHAIGAGAVYLLRDGDHGQRLAPAACWPGPGAGALLAESARAVMRASEAARRNGPHLDEPASPAPVLGGGGVVALPITSEGEALGVLVLAGQASMAEQISMAEQADGRLPEQNTLSVVIGVMALLIRNSQLHAQLESQAVLDERNHLAAEVHDGVAQSLGFLNVKVQQVQRLLARGQVAEATAALQELRDGSQEVYAEVRRLIEGLRWTMGDQGGLADRLQQYASALAARTGLEVTMDARAEPDLPPEAQHQLFRVVQEALSNVHRHAHARRVSARLSEGPDGVTLSIEDDGTGLRPLAYDGDHFGLRIMRERVQSIGGDLRVESRPGAGTALTIQVPTGAAGERREEESWSASVS